MPIPGKYANLTKTDRRKQWKGLKDKHSKAISKAKLDFDQKLGPALDKYQTQVDKLTQAAAKTEVTSTMVQPILDTTAPLKKTVPAYKDSVKKLDDPAKKEMSDLLTAIDHDVISWEELVLATMGTISKGTTDEQKKAAHSVITILDNIRSMCLMIITRGPRAVEAYKKENKRPLGISLASAMVESARSAGSASHELANAAQQVVAGTNYELFKARAKAADTLIQKSLDAAGAYKAKWKISLPDFINIGDTDAKVLESNFVQIESDFTAAITLLHKLP